MTCMEQLIKQWHDERLQNANDKSISNALKGQLKASDEVIVRNLRGVK